MIALAINGKSYSVDVEPDAPLLWVLRDTIGRCGAEGRDRSHAGRRILGRRRRADNFGGRARGPQRRLCRNRQTYPHGPDQEHRSERRIIKSKWRRSALIWRTVQYRNR